MAGNDTNDRSDEKARLGAADWFYGAILVVATLIAYHTVWQAGFIWDDDKYVTENPLLTAPDGLWRIWFSLDAPSQYFPLTYTTFYFEHLIWGFNPVSYHVINALLHTANVLLVWRLLAELRVPGAWLAAALFALHPLQVESVAWVSERKNVLMGFFFLLALLAWMKFIDARIRRRGWFYALALVCYVLALSAKTTACTLPAALILVLWYQKMPIGGKRWAQVAPFVGLGIGMGLVTVWWERFHQGTHGAVFAIGPVERVLIASRALWFYLGKLVWPANLIFSYPRWKISASDWPAYGWLLATVVLTVVIWRMRRRAGRGVETAAVFYAATLSPVIGFIMLWTFQYSFVADHYQYLACIGPLALLAAGIESGCGWLSGKAPFWRPIGCAILLSVLGGLTLRQCAEYADANTLWRATLAKNPDSWLGHDNLAVLLLNSGNTAAAVDQLNLTLQINPRDEIAHNDLGLILRQRGQVDDAIKEFGKALDILPGSAEIQNNLGNALAVKGDLVEAIAHYRKAVELRPNSAEAHNGLGSALMRRGDNLEGIAQFQKALELQPNFPLALKNLRLALFQKGDFEGAMACLEQGAGSSALAPEGRWFNLGKVFFEEGNSAEAITCFQRTVAVNPRLAEAWADLGTAWQRTRQSKEAVAAWQKSLELNPAQLPIQNNVAWVLATSSDATMRDGAKAVSIAEQVNQTTKGTIPIVQRTLAAAYAETGRYTDAVSTAGKALAQARAQNNPTLASALEEQIKFYETGRPFRE
jgi:tetratricopeptide (TPR) repeat protein